MKTLPVTFGPAARRDIIELHNYILNISGSLNTADGYIDRLYSFCLDIGHVPNGGLTIALRRGQYRRRVFERSLIVIYEVRQDAVEIRRVFSGRKLVAAFAR